MNPRHALPLALVALLAAGCAGSRTASCPTDGPKRQGHRILVPENSTDSVNASPPDVIDVIMQLDVIDNKTVDQRCDDMGGITLIIDHDVICHDIDY